ncbi:MAG TPA: penicillin-binding transpeptidase domain-containing protein [Polyangiaceae bacterium]|jgi:cell division protein FtsI/penicillin-binding protein 2|nr:penicillin-binding transpeptidase domain-containing protein [Polyangiaceae bacterium]
MQTWRRWAAMGVTMGVIGALFPLLGSRRELPVRHEAPLRRLSEPQAPAPPTPELRGIDLLAPKLRSGRLEAPLDGGLSAQLTLDPELQSAATSVLERYDVPEAGVVLMQVKSGDLLTYASRVRGVEPFDVNARAEAPAASVFKLVTTAALLDKPGIGAQTEQCYRGGMSRIQPDELRDDPALDRWCASLAMAMGKSINVVFARLARRWLTPEELSSKARELGFGAPVPFEVANEAARAELPSDPLEFARAAAGFWHTTLSPLAAASLAQTIANGGVTYKPRIVRSVRRDDEVIWQAPHEPETLRRALPARAAHELTTMMLQTVASGSAYKAFHTPQGTEYLPHLAVAGKTGTLTRHEADRHYTWFVGFAPADRPEVAIATLVVNTAIWRIKAPQLAREVLRAYFADRRAPGVTPP